MTYGDRNRPTRVVQPGLGEVLLRYDTPTGLLREVVAADGVVTTSRDRDPVTDGLRELGIDRGSAPWISWFQLDGQERLWKSWDDLGVSSAASPNVELSYAFAGANTPGRIRNRTMVAPGSYQEVVDLTSASGASLATLGRMPSGWQVSGLTATDRRELESRRFWRGPLASSVDLSTLTWTSLRSGATQLGVERSSGGGLPVASEHVLGAGVTRRVASTEQLVSDTVVTTAVENAAFSTQVATDAAGDLRWTKDEAGATTQLAYDALGRLIGVTLADGSQHLLRYEGYGKIAEITRPGLASVRYEYDPVTGLTTRKRVLDGDGALERTIDWTRDAIGRITQELHTQPRTGASRSFTYHHDGLIDGTVEPGQRGKLSQVVGPDFVRTARFDRDGSQRSSSLRIAGWRQIDQTWARFENGDIREETWVVRNGSGQELSRLTQTNLRDAWGRPSEIRVNGAPFAAFEYDPEGRLAIVNFADGSELIPSYDVTTHARDGHWADMRAWVSGTFWTYNARGQIATEQVTTDGGFWERAHEYDARGMLVRTHDASSESRSSYGPTGLPTSMADLAGQRTITRTGRTIGVEASAGGAYQLDASGRVLAHDGLALTWGPTGEIDEASRGSRTWSYLYDDAGQRIGKREGTTMLAGYAGTMVLEENRAVLPVKLAGVLIGIWELTSSGAHFQPVSTDPRGTLLADSAGANPATPYGVRARHLAESAALDYVERGYDADLGTIRFGVRDYDPKLGQFWSPDPLFLEDIEKCATSPLECNLYGYAKGNPLSFIDPSGMEARTAAGRELRSAALAAGSPDSPSFNWDTLAAGSTLTGEDAANRAWGCSSNCRTWHDQVSSAGAGFGDTVTFGASAAIRDVSTLGGETVHPDSFAYGVGVVGGIIIPTGSQIAASQIAARGASAAYAAATTSRGIALGTGAFLEGSSGGAGLGKLTGRSIQVSQKGLGMVENHLAQFGSVPQNTAMVSRLRNALASGSPVTGADASFYLHELSEATMMGRGMSYEAAHGAALAKYGVSPFSVYAPEVVTANPTAFNGNWYDFWSLPK